MRSIQRPLEKQGPRLVLAAALLLFSWLALSRYLGAGRDDTFITLWAGENLAAGRGLVNQNFERVEISSSLLHVLVVAVLAKLGPHSVYTANKLAGLFAGLGLFGVIHWNRNVLFPQPNLRFAAQALSFWALATTPSLLYWTCGGLETPFVTLLVLATAVSYLGFWQKPTAPIEATLIIAQILLLMVRPESFYIIPFTLIFAALYTAVQGKRLALLRIVLTPTAFFLAMGVLRRCLFGTFFPNPVYAKTRGIMNRFDGGLFYLQQFYSSGWFQAFLGVATTVIALYYAHLLARSCRRIALLKSSPDVPLVFILGLVVTLHLVVLFSGGDWMEYFRFMSPVTPLQVTLAAYFAPKVINGLLVTTRRVRFTRFTSRLTACTVTLFLVSIWSTAPLQSGGVASDRSLRKATIESASTPCDLRDLLAARYDLDEFVKCLNRCYERDSRILFPFLDAKFVDLYSERKRLVIATPQMGLFPYYLKNRYPDFDLFFLDTRGLCDQKIALLDMEGNHFGIAQGGGLAEVMTGRAGPLSQYVLSKDPNMLYRLTEPADGIAELEAMGFALVSSTPGALIFYKT